MSVRRQVAAYVVLLGGLALFWLGFDQLGRPMLFLLFGIPFAAAAMLVVDAWRKVFGLGKREANNVDP